MKIICMKNWKILHSTYAAGLSVGLLCQYNNNGSLLTSGTMTGQQQADSQGTYGRSREEDDVQE